MFQYVYCAIIFLFCQIKSVIQTILIHIKPATMSSSHQFLVTKATNFSFYVMLTNIKIHKRKPDFRHIIRQVSDAMS